MLYNGRMGILRRLFGGADAGRSGNADGFFLYVRCDRCGDKVRLRVHKQHDLNQAEGGYVWHKTIIDNRCFRPMPTVVHFDHNYNVSRAEIEGGRYIERDEYEAGDIGQTTGTREGPL